MLPKPEEIFLDCYNVIKGNAFKGYDPYDLLNSRFSFWEKLSPLGVFYLTQINKRSVINFRKFLGVELSLIPKGKSLILQSLIKQRALISTSITDIEFLVDSILKDKFENYSGACWGLPFEYVNRNGRRGKSVGDVVATAFVHQGLSAYWNLEISERIKPDILSCTNFVLKDLGLEETSQGMRLNYETQTSSTVLNSIGFASDILVRNYRIDRNLETLKIAEKLLDFIVHFQDDNGLFPYAVSKNIKNYQTDFHQLYVISSLLNFQISTYNYKYVNQIQKGLEFYLKYQITDDGQTHWRYPVKYPVDIHNQATALYYLSTFAPYLQFNTTLIDNIFTYTTKHFYDPVKNYFYYQKYPLIKNKINYIRWGQSWMLMALSQYIIWKRENL